MADRTIPSTPGWWWCSIQGSQEQPVWVFAGMKPSTDVTDAMNELRVVAGLERRQPTKMWASVYWASKSAHDVNDPIFVWSTPVVSKEQHDAALAEIKALRAALEVVRDEALHAAQELESLADATDDELAGSSADRIADRLIGLFINRDTGERIELPSAPVRTTDAESMVEPT